jgi:hypothetical protein
MIKYRVILQQGCAEFLDESEATSFSDSNEGIRIDTINDTTVPPIPLIEVPMWKLRIVLVSMELIDSVTSLLNTLPEPNKTAATIAWEYGNTIDSHGQTIAFLQAGLGLTDQQVVDIFTQADLISI